MTLRPLPSQDLSWGLSRDPISNHWGAFGSDLQGLDQISTAKYLSDSYAAPCKFYNPRRSYGYWGILNRALVLFLQVDGWYTATGGYQVTKGLITSLTHKPPLMHGAVAHSSTSASQSSPANPRRHSHRKWLGRSTHAPWLRQGDDRQRCMSVSHRLPVKWAGQEHACEPTVLTQIPPLRHADWSPHSFTSSSQVGPEYPTAHEHLNNNERTELGPVAPTPLNF